MAQGPQPLAPAGCSRQVKRTVLEDSNFFEIKSLFKIFAPASPKAPQPSATNNRIAATPAAPAPTHSLALLTVTPPSAKTGIGDALRQASPSTAKPCPGRIP